MISKEEIKTKDFSDKLCQNIDKLSFISGRLHYLDYQDLGDDELRGVSFILRDMADDLNIIHDTLYE